MADRTFIFAGSVEQFADYLRRHNLNPREYEFLGASYGEKLRGVRGAKVIRVGAWYEREDTDALAEAFSQGRVTITTERT